MNKNISNKKNDSLNPELIPAIIQDYKSGQVLMLAYMNRKSFIKSVKTKSTWFWSRSRKELWNKGATSGNSQQIKEIRYDCDNDALLIKVQQQGPACHTGNESCFFNIFDIGNKEKKGFKSAEDISGMLKFSDDSFSSLNIIEELYNTIISRIEQESEKSYTYALHKAGLEEILKKIGEEAVEIILSAKHQSRKRTISEISDLVYHLLVLMAEKKIKPRDICRELDSRKK
ncbi:MAG: bifunctional phosphoribosyl-AMP cyclohydrolase/phosphoribosyl-ATP diphosphatase HisIE [Actinobacteria bacterium]|nr:bifunctional phosphoribosyl-AMP cyclohydrolase/phosphoribosyl-ATP diphosphatase HisIE [Actinomycetota bacterium]